MGRIALWGLFVIFLAGAAPAARSPYPWQGAYDAEQSLEKRFAAPAGATRVEAERGSFAAWLRALPLKQGKPEVLMFDGRKKANQAAHAAVIDIDTGNRDLQQCADAVIRLRAEYLWHADRRKDIVFTFTSGDRAEHARWAEGYRPIVKGNQVTWSRTAKADDSYASFKGYLDTVFTYAGTRSLARDLRETKASDPYEIGDVFVQGGSPGHAVIVVDVATRADGRRVFMLAQSYMPAQDIHVLRNAADEKLSPWFEANVGDTLRTPEWTFKWTDRRRF